jgi:hypothetical protein
VAYCDLDDDESDVAGALVKTLAKTKAFAQSRRCQLWKISANAISEQYCPYGCASGVLAFAGWPPD